MFAAPIDLDVRLEPPVYSKTAAQRQFLDRAMRDQFLFAHLTQDEFITLVDAMQYQCVTQGTVIIQQGDIGDFFYIVESGRVDFIDEEKGGLCVGRVKSGGTFGELALLYDMVHAVSCVASTTEQVELWKVDKTTFRSTLR